MISDAHYILKERINKSRLLSKRSRFQNIKVLGVGKHSS